MGPLKGIRVVEFAGIGPGPFAAMMLRRLRSLMVESDDRLATYLRWRVGQPARAINRQRVPFRCRRKAR